MVDGLAESPSNVARQWVSKLKDFWLGLVCGIGFKDITRGYPYPALPFGPTGPTGSTVGILQILHSRFSDNCCSKQHGSQAHS